MNTVATQTAAPEQTKGSLVTDWRPEDPQFWESTGKIEAGTPAYIQNAGFVWVLIAAPIREEPLRSPASDRA